VAGLLPNATLTASPNPVLISPTSQVPKAVSLAWNTGNANLSGQINIGQCGGQTIGAARPSGTATYTVKPAQTYLFLLCDPSRNVLVTTSVVTQYELALPPSVPTPSPTPQGQPTPSCNNPSCIYESLSAAPNPVVIQPPSTQGTVLLTWAFAGPNAQVFVGNCNGQTVGSPGSTGNATYTVYQSQSTTFVLCDTSLSGFYQTASVTVSTQLPQSSDLKLYPNEVRTGYDGNADYNMAIGCGHSDVFSGYDLPQGPSPVNPDAVTSADEIAVGYYVFNVPGTPPVACWSWGAAYYRGAVGFDMGQVNSFIQAHGLKNATLAFNQISGQGSSSGPSSGPGADCVRQIQVNDDSWNQPETNFVASAAWAGNSATIAGGILQTPPFHNDQNESQTDPGALTVDLTAILALESSFSSQPNMHFVFIGYNESLSQPSDTSQCVAIFGNFTLDLQPAH
jgi:hypothetical protein